VRAGSCEPVSACRNSLLAAKIQGIYKIPSPEPSNGRNWWRVLNGLAAISLRVGTGNCVYPIKELSRPTGRPWRSSISGQLPPSNRFVDGGAVNRMRSTVGPGEARGSVH
jgi:hypothetical protein